MTEEEDQINAAKNEVIRACHHNLKTEGQRVFCTLCEVRFMPLLLPRRAQPRPISDWDDY